MKYKSFSSPPYFIVFTMFLLQQLQLQVRAVVSGLCFSAGVADGAWSNVNSERNADLSPVFALANYPV